LFKIESIGSGFIAIMAYPGKEQDAASAIASLARVGIRQVVSLLEPAEAQTLGLEREAQLVVAESMKFVSFPIPDMGLPASVCAFAGLARDLYRQVAAGDNTLLHCRGGVGRSGLLAAAVLLHCRPANGSRAYAACASRKPPSKGHGCGRIKRQLPTSRWPGDVDERSSGVNLLLDEYAENPVIDELVFWPPKKQRMISVRACSVMFRKPFIEVELEDGEVFHRHFARPSFVESWAEACVILETVSRIKLISEFSFNAVDDRERLVAEVLARRDECIAESNLMFDEGMYTQFLQQYGEDCRDLPADAERRIATARQHLSSFVE